MCGISGIWNQKGLPVDLSDARKFNDAMAHRGPDHGALEVLTPSLIFGHRRLSILDTSAAAHQPMWDSTGRYCMVFNGEVFNFIELRTQLESHGERFKSQGDSEVVLAAYRRWGMEAFHRFNGMWAIAIWDAHEQELLLCRDRFGIKPLYYQQSDDGIAFASETKAFDELAGFEKRIDSKQWHRLQPDVYALEGIGYTLYHDIFQVLPGHFIRLKDGERVSQRRWYDIQEANLAIPRNYEERVEQFLEIFQDACLLRMRSDVTMATALSGGVDSTAVYSTIHHAMKSSSSSVMSHPKEWQKAFVATFPGTTRDERVWAEKALKYTGGEAVFIEPDYSDLLPRLIASSKAHDGLTGTPIIALSDVYRAMRQHHVTVSLDGHGVDEMLYGYIDMVYQGMSHHLWNGDRQDAKASIDVLVGLFPEENRTAKRTSLMADFDRVMGIRRSARHRLKKQVKNWVSKPTSAGLSGLASISDRPYDFSRLDALDAKVKDEFFLRTLPALLHNFDIASMMSSVEIRMPFMDYRLVEYAFRLPYRDKVGGGYTKRILRDAMKGIMPEENRTRTYKVGLGAPTKDWLAGPLHEWMGDVLNSSCLIENGMFQSKAIEDARLRWKERRWSEGEAAEDWKLLNTYILLQR